jgi:hypothetical protein
MGTRAYKPNRNIFDRFRWCPKAFPKAAFSDARFAAISACPVRMGTNHPFRPDSIHHIPTR